MTRSASVLWEGSSLATKCHQSERPSPQDPGVCSNPLHLSHDVGGEGQSAQPCWKVVLQDVSEA